MSEGVKRAILRWIHILFGVPIVGYIYTPFDQLHYFARSIRFFFLPVLVLSGFWMWKGHLLRRLFARSAQK
jgi:hypothetical protein